MILPILDPVLKFKRHPITLKSKTMNAQETLEAIDIMKAWTEGEDVELQVIDGTYTGWDAVTKPAGNGSLSWRFDLYRYRRKPKPQEFWIVIRPNERTGPWFYTETAANMCANVIPDAKIIHVKQVL